MRTLLAVSVIAPLSLFGVFADKEWTKRTFAPTNAAVAAERAAETNAMQSAAIAALQASKQDTIADLSAIRSGAAAGATAVQPAAVSDMASRTWVGQQGYVKQSQLQYPVTDVRTGGVSVVSGGVADFTIPDVELPETWPWESVSGRPTTWAWANLTGVPSWITAQSPVPTTWAWGSVTGKPQLVNSVNGMSGDVDLTALDVKARGSCDLQVYDPSDQLRGGIDYWTRDGTRMTWDPETVVWRAGDDYSYEIQSTGYEGRFLLITRGGSQEFSGYDVTVGGKRYVAVTLDRIAKMSEVVPATRKVNGQPLTSDVTISFSGPEKVSDLRFDSATTNFVRETAGSFWDPGLTVVWRMFCTNGCFFVTAVTNVNTTGVQP